MPFSSSKQFGDVDATKFKFDSFMRVCSDRPFFYYELALKMKKTFQIGDMSLI